MFFSKSHPIFQNVIKIRAVNLLGVTYETDDSYAMVWCRDMISALETQKIVNEIVGYNVCCKPVTYKRDDMMNPFTQEATGMELVNEEIAKRNEEYAGDNFVRAIVECAEAGVVINLHG
jgi:hypothetical protein